MPNGECPIGARNAANIEHCTHQIALAHDRVSEVGREMRGEVKRIDDRIDRVELAAAWDLKRLIIAGLLVLLGSGGGNVLADMLKAMIAGGK